MYKQELTHDLEMLKVALECYMGKDLEEDSNLSRPVKQALKDFEELINSYVGLMASKENQFALDVVAHALPFDNYICEIHTLQQAIDNEELYKKALDKACKRLEKYMMIENQEGKTSCLFRNEWEEYLLEQAQKELENANTKEN